MTIRVAARRAGLVYLNPRALLIGSLFAAIATVSTVAMAAQIEGRGQRSPGNRALTPASERRGGRHRAP